MRSTTPTDLSGICPRCYLREQGCLCDTLTPLFTRTEIVVIRHVSERHVTSNTGRLAALRLPRCRIVDFGGGGTFDDDWIRDDSTWLLYPGCHAQPEGPPPRRLIVLDATFRRARRMYRKIDALRSLPELSLSPPSIAPTRLRQPTRPDGMSTIEAIAAALSLLEDPALLAPLLATYDDFVSRSDRIRGRVRPSPAVPEEPIS
jgi:DTW domain-containing protein